METYNNYLTYLKQFINADYLNNTLLSVNKNKGGYDSITVSSPGNTYRNAVSNLFAKIKIGGKNPYIAFLAKFLSDFNALGYTVKTVKSDSSFFRIGLNDFFGKDLTDEEKSKLSAVINRIFLDSLSFSSFGCCSKYKECSTSKKCLHSDQLYATACMYRKHLEGGNAFYSKKMIRRSECND